MLACVRVRWGRVVISAACLLRRHRQLNTRPNRINETAHSRSRGYRHLVVPERD
jgi:hypothetical protein